MMGQFWTLLEEGLVLMAIGMGFVFAFLAIMVFTMNGMSGVVKFLNKFFPEEVKVVEKPGKRSNVSVDEAVAVAIAVAKLRG